MTDPGEGSQGPGPLPAPLFLHQTEARKAEKIFGDRAFPLSQGLDDRAPSLSQGLDLTLACVLFLSEKYA